MNFDNIDKRFYKTGYGRRGDIVHTLILYTIFNVPIFIFL